MSIAWLPQFLRNDAIEVFLILAGGFSSELSFMISLFFSSGREDTILAYAIKLH